MKIPESEDEKSKDKTSIKKDEAGAGSEREAVKADEKKAKSEPKRGPEKADKPARKASETVGLSPEELRRISGGHAAPMPGDPAQAKKDVKKP